MSRAVGIAAALLAAASFGFFYSWTISMWGLDAADPGVALASMVSLNEGVRNPLFFAVFAGAPIAALVAAVTATVRRCRVTAVWFVAAAVALASVVVVTAIGNVPLNQSIATLPAELYDATTWTAFSLPWQGWNAARAVAAGCAVICCGLGLLAMGRENSTTAQRTS